MPGRLLVMASLACILHAVSVLSFGSLAQGSARLTAAILIPSSLPTQLTVCSMDAREQAAEE